mgnify:CR=1 FL=1
MSLSPKKFYDIHFHAMDLSHANITAFTDRFINNPDAIKKILDGDFPWWKKSLYSLLGPLLPVAGPFVSNRFLARKITGQLAKLKNVRNLLSFMETSVMYDFLIIEHFLKNDHADENKNVDERKIVNADNSFTVDGYTYNKIVLCPLVMDFGYPNLRNKDVYYNIPPQKPVVSQICDLYEAIYTYFKKELTIKNENDIIKFEVRDTSQGKGEKLFEIYPFMGINTANYTLEKIERMLEKYFADFRKNDSPEQRYQRLYDAMGEFDGRTVQDAQFRNIFAGIKLYPPLGFNPWPEESAVEMKKVETLYSYCAERNIPIITHCSTGGFVASPEHTKFTNPGGQWAKVLADPRFKKLKIDFAHMGVNDPGWTDTIFKMALNSEMNVFTDISSICDSPDYYAELKEVIGAYPTGANNKVLYGSDFMINLLNVRSYNQYMKYFTDTSQLSPVQKHLFANANPEKFLFG